MNSKGMGSGKFGMRRTAMALAVASAFGLGAVDAQAVTSTLVRVATTANVAAGVTNTQSATKTTTTANDAGTLAVTTITVNAAPTATETLTVGSCVVSFVAGNSTSLQDSVNCTSKAATIDLSTGTAGNVARTPAELAAALQTLTNVAGVGFGALTVGGSGADVTFTAANKIANNPVTATSNNSGAFAVSGGTAAFNSANTTVGVAPVAQIDTITISGTIEAGDVFSASLPGPDTASYTALNGNTADNVATGLNADILARAGYGAQAFTSGVATNIVTLTAKVAGTGFAVTSTATNQAAVAEVDTFTPASVTAGERFRITLGGLNYDYVAQTGDTATRVANGLRTALGTPAGITPSGTSTVTLTAATPGTAFAATSSVLSNLAYSATTFNEAGGNAGAIGNTATITLTGDTFTGSNGDDWSAAVTNTPAGLTASLIRTSATVLTLSFSGNATAHANAQGISNLTVTLADGKFSGGSAAVVGNATKADLVVDFVDSDIIAPTVTTYFPADGAIGVSTTGTLSLAFSENVMALSNSNIYIKSGGTIVETIAANDTTKVSGGKGGPVYINPTTVLAPNTPYNVEIDAFAFADTSTPPNTYAGILDTTTWNFTTGAADTAVPTISSVSPANNATNINPASDLSITFSEYIKAGAGNIVIKTVTSSAIVETIAAADTSKVSISKPTTGGSKATINPSTTLASNTAYYVEIDATAFKDKADNAYAGMSGNATWNFTTKATDTFAPVIRSLTLGTTTSSGVSASSIVNEDATVYYVVTPCSPNCNWPTAAEVAAGTGSGGAAATTAGSVAMTAEIATTINVTGLSPSTIYGVFYTAKDSANNLTTYPGGANAYYDRFTTSAAPAASPPGDSGVYVPPPTPTDAPAPAGVDMPEGTSLTYISNISSVLDNGAGATTGVTLNNGMLSVDPDAIAATGMNFSSGVASGTAFMLNDTASNMSVPINFNGNTIIVMPESNTLMIIGMVTMEDGTSSKALVVSSGTATMNGDKQGELIGALGGAPAMRPSTPPKPIQRFPCPAVRTEARFRFPAVRRTSPYLGWMVISRQRTNSPPTPNKK